MLSALLHTPDLTLTLVADRQAALRRAASARRLARLVRPSPRRPVRPAQE